MDVIRVVLGCEIGDLLIPETEAGVLRQGRKTGARRDPLPCDDPSGAPGLSARQSRYHTLGG